MINFENVSFCYKCGHEILKNINLNIKKNEFVAIIGRNGSGKSTIAKLLNGIFVPNCGKIYVNNIDTSDEKNLINLRQTVGVVFQNPENQFVASSVEEDIAFGPENLAINRLDIENRINKSLAATKMEKFRFSSIHNLSGGEKQKIAISSVLALETNVLILDEPTSMIDPCGRIEIINLLKKLNKNGRTVILITHNIEETIFCDRVFVLDDGKISLAGLPRDVISEVEYLEKIGLSVPDSTKITYLLKQKQNEIKLALTNDECIYEILKTFR